MTKQDVTNFFKNAKTTLAFHSPEILIGVGIAGMISATVLAVTATPKALKLIDEEKQRQNADLMEEANEEGAEDCREITELKPLEVIDVTWKCYLPAAILSFTSAACIIGANKVHMRRAAALATAYKLSETALTDYKDKVVKVLGEKKEQAVRESMAKDDLEKHPVSKSEIIITKNGTTRFLDPISGRHFLSDIEQIKKIINELNRQMLVYDYVSLNEFYDEVGLDHIPLGNDLGWKITDGLIKPLFSSQIDDDGVPCIVLKYEIAPKYGYSNYT